MDRTPSTYWRAYYAGIADSDQHWLDLSNPRVHAQSLSLCLEAAGEVRDCSCLDLGCGHGLLAGMLKASGADPVCGVDLVEGLIERNRHAFPEIQWRVGDATDPAFIDALPAFDRAFLVEVLQYVDLSTFLPRLWRCVRPGGRLIGMVPNADCPIVARSLARFEGYYRAARPEAMADLAANLEGVACWARRGLWFAPDQRITPYVVGPWTTDPPSAERPPNRINFAILKLGP
jgi:SAM-dependent methyltransferase